MVIVAYKCRSRRHVSLAKRDWLGINALEATKLSNLSDALSIALKALNILKKRCRERYLRTKRRLKRMILSIYSEIVKIVRVELPDRALKKKYERKTIEDFQYLEYSSNESFSERFRFNSVAQLLRLKEGFQLPAFFRSRGSRFTGEEALLISLIRLSYPSRWSDVMNYFPGRDRAELQRAFYAF